MSAATTETLEIRAEPLTADPSACRFTLSHALHAGSHLCASPQEARGSELLEALFALSCITQAWVSGTTLTLRKSPGSEDWRAIAPRVGSLLRSFVTAGKTFAPPSAVGRHDSASGGSGADDAVRTRIERLLRDQVNPGVASHGGRIELVDYRDGQARLRMSGGCQGCSSAKATLGQGVEKILRAHVPELRGIIDVTDHAAGERPFHA